MKKRFFEKNRHFFAKKQNIRLVSKSLPVEAIIELTKNNLYVFKTPVRTALPVFN